MGRNYHKRSTEINGILGSLNSFLESAGLSDSTGHSISGRAFATVDSAGALFNLLFAEENRSDGVHYTDYAVGFLQSSINLLLTGDPNGARQEKSP